MSTPATVLTSKILAEHGARPDLRLWRNPTGRAWAGSVKKRQPNGCMVLHPGAVNVEFGLCIGSADIVGIQNETGRFIALEVKAGRDTLSEQQRRWLELIEEFGGIAAVVSSVEDVDRVLGQAP